MGIEWIITWAAVIISLVALLFSLSKPPIKDWIIVYFLKAFISLNIAVFLVAQERFIFPVRFLPEVYQTSILFDLLVFPILCVLYNQTSYKSNLRSIIIQSVLYSGIMTAIEVWLERYTKLIEYINWSWLHTFAYLIITFLAVRAIMAIIRKLSKDDRLFR
ncbi:MAG: hypothetical protein FH758_13940 [Firmicutes bacterium]|nr:hypothetical protein [Bacillota bacterium]